TIPTASCAAATASCRWISTCPAARPRPRRCSTACCSSRRRSCAPRNSRANPMAEALTVLADLGRGKLAQDLVSAEVKHGELTVVASRPAIVKVLKTLRDDPDFRFTILVDLCGADWPEREQRFDVVYHLLSLSQNQRI